MYSVGIGLLKLSQLSGGSSWMGNCQATLRRHWSVYCHVTGREIVAGRESIIDMAIEGAV